LLKCFLLLLTLVGFEYSCGQPFQVLPVPGAIRTGAYGSPQPNALHSAVNQAALGAVKTFAAALYAEKRFLLQELSLYNMAIAQPAGAGAFGLQTTYGGSVDYNTTKIALAYGRSLGAKVAVGLQFDYLAHQIRGYGSAANVAAELGLLVHFSKAFHAGFQICHPAGISLSKSAAQLPAVYTAGIEYRPAAAVALTAELIKTERIPLAVVSGIE
jgi:hypothetical protein